MLGQILTSILRFLSVNVYRTSGNGLLITKKKLSQIVENRGKSDSENAVEFITAGTDLINEEVHFNLGGNYEFTFSVEGHSSLFYLYPYVVSQLPEQFKDKWHFFPFNQGTDSSFSFGMYGVSVAMDQVKVAVTYQEDINAFSIRFYEKKTCVRWKKLKVTMPIIS